MFSRALSVLLAFPVPSLAQSCETPTREVVASAGSELRGISLLGVDGSESTLGELVPGFARGDVVVLCYTEIGCPIAARTTARLTRLAQEHENQGVRFLAIDASAQDSREEIEREARELERGFPVVKDVRQELTRALGARTTTEVFVFDGQGRPCYRGAIDDQYELGAARPEPTRPLLANALASVLSGRPVDPAVTPAPGCELTLLADGLPESVTWSRDVAPIVQRRCESCHRPGQAGPFTLQSYEDAKGRARMLAKVIEEGIMPPWNADARYDGVFSNERKLTADEKTKLLAWVNEGMPRGTPAEDPAPRKWPEGWSIGEPDVVFTMEESADDGKLPPEGFAVPREGVVDYQYFTVQTSYPEDRWIQKLEVRPGASDVVHHVLILARDPAKPAQRFDERSYLAVYVPGDTPSVYPQGYAKRLPAGATLIFQLHYTPNGKERFDRSSLALVFADEPPEFEVITDAVVNDEFEIPAGAANHEVRGTLTLTEDTGIVALFPHMHTRGKDFRFVAHTPDGNESELLFSHYDFNWQESYLLPDPLFLPTGTELECIGHFDNSTGNPNNPDPTVAVRWGEQTFEEMFIGYFDTVVPVE